MAGACVCVCACEYIPQGLHLRWLLCCVTGTNDPVGDSLTAKLCAAPLTHTTLLQLPMVIEACWSQGKLPLHILSAQRKCQSACPNQRKSCVYASKMYFTSCPCPSRLLTADKHCSCQDSSSVLVLKLLFIKGGNCAEHVYHSYTGSHLGIVQSKHTHT